MFVQNLSNHYKKRDEKTTRKRKFSFTETVGSYITSLLLS